MFKIHPQTKHQPFNSPHLLYLRKAEIQALDGHGSQLYLDAVRRSFMLHAQGRYVQPLKPYLRPGMNCHVADRIIVMPAYLLDENPIAGIKMIGSKQNNPAQHLLPRANGVIVLMDAQTHAPIAMLEASHISGMRTAAVTTLATQYLARPQFKSIACIGCGPIAEMQLRSLLENFDSIETVRLFDLNPAASNRLASLLRQAFSAVQIFDCSSAQATIESAEVVITCTIAEKPYIPFDWISPGAFISNISIMDLQPEVFLNADKVIVDDWEQSNREKKILNQLVLARKFSWDDLHAELGEIITGLAPGRETNDEIIVLNPMGMAIEDIACAQAIFHQAHIQNSGTILPLY